MSSEGLFARFSANFGKLLDSGEGYDIEIQVGQEPITKIFRAHSNILRAQSPYFAAALSSEWAKKEENLFVFKKPNITPAVFEVILRFIYTASISLIRTTPEDAIDLLVAADEIILPEFIEHVEEHLIEKETEWLNENFDYVFGKAFKHELWVQLQDFCLESLCESPMTLLNSERFLTFDESIVIGLLKRDDLVVDEITLWDRVIQWGIACTPGLSDNISNWSLPQFEALAKTTANCVKYVRFFRMSVDDLYTKVRPFTTVIPRNVYEDALWYHLKPKDLDPMMHLTPRGDSIDSNLIKLKHAAIIASWVDHEPNPYEYGRIPYNFRLVVRGSRDGFTSTAFSSRCQNASPTVVVMRVSDTRELLGGYNPTNWYWSINSGNYWKSTSESFIFSFADMRRVTTANMSRVHPGFVSNAIYVNGNTGPDFGNSDLRMVNNFNSGNCYCARLRYEHSISNVVSPFSICEYEVFQLLKKTH